MNWYLKAWKKYAVFDGRASRTEYWMFFLFNVLAGFVLGFVEGVLGAISNTDQSVLSTIYSLAVMVPSLAVGWRRMHDIDRSGWWLLLPIVNLVFLATEGTKGGNEFGPDPWGNSPE